MSRIRKLFLQLLLNATNRKKTAHLFSLFFENRLKLSEKTFILCLIHDKILIILKTDENQKKLKKMPGLENDKPITQILSEIRDTGQNGLDEVLPLVYDELRRLADAYLKNERKDHTLQPTALVHEAYLRLIGQKEIKWESRSHFFGVLARLMRQILIEYARMRSRQKRGGEFQTRIALDAAISFENQKELDVLAVDEALSKLEKLDEQQAQIVEMKFFGGMTVEEIAEVVGVSPATVKRDWSSAKLLLYRMLKK